VGSLDDLTSPPKERHDVPNDNVITNCWPSLPLIEPREHDAVEILVTRGLVSSPPEVRAQSPRKFLAFGGRPLLLWVDAVSRPVPPTKCGWGAIQTITNSAMNRASSHFLRQFVH